MAAKPPPIDRGYLFGILAVQLGFTRPQAVMSAASAWLADRAQPVSERLVENGSITEQQRSVLEALVDQAIRAHGGDVKQTLQTFGGEASVLMSFGGSIVLDQDGGVSPNPTAKGEGHAEGDDTGVTPEAKGRYRFDATGFEIELGHGGIGRVLVALDTHLGRDVAIKELLGEGHGSSSSRPRSDGLSRTSAAAARFLREARVTGQLEHPSIVPVHEVGQREDGTYYYTMKVVRGRTLSAALKECGSLHERLRLLPHYADVCQAIAYAHSRGVIHRDIKPDNVMIGQFGETVVLDWGLAKVKGSQDLRGSDLKRDLAQLKEQDTAKTVDGAAIGTPAYMSPEQAEGAVDEIDERSDVWSLGAVLYEMLTGRAPYEGVTPYEIIGKVIQDDARPPREVDVSIPPELAAVASKALRRSREERYASAAEVAAEIQAYLTGARIQAYEYSSWELLAGFVRKHKATSASALVVLLVIVASSIVLLGAYRDADAQRHRAQENQAQAHRSETEAHYNLAIALRDRADLLLERKYMLGARIYAAASLLHNPANPRSPYHDTGASEAYPGAELVFVDAYSLYAQAGQTAEFVPGPILKHGGTLRAAAFSPDGKRLATGGDLKSVSLWDVDAKRLLAESVPSNAPCSILAYSPDGNTLAAGHTDGTIQLLSGANLHPVSTFHWHERSVSALAFDASSNVLYSVSRKGRALAWDRTRGALRELLPANRVGVTAAIHPGKELIALGHPDLPRRVDLLDLRSKRTIELTTTVRVNNVMTFSRDGSWLAVAGNDRAEHWIWDIEAGRLKGVIDGAGETVGAQFFPDGERLATIGAESLQVSATYSLSAVQALAEHTGRARGIAVSPSAAVIATCGDDNEVALWVRAQRAGSRSIEGRDRRYYMRYSPDGKKLAVTGPYLEVLNVDTLQPSFRVEGACVGVDFSRDGTTIATGGRDGKVRLWNAATGGELGELGEHEGYVRHVRFSPDGRSIVSADWASVKVWDVASRSMKRELDAGGGVVFSPDGKLLAAGSPSGVVRLLDASSGDLRSNLTAMGGGVDDVAFSHGGRWLAATSKHGEVRVWDLADASGGERFFDLEGHALWVDDADFSPDDALLATAGDDNRIRVWSLATRKPALILRSEAISSAFSPDGRTLAVGDGKRVRLVPLNDVEADADPRQLLERAEREARRKLREMSLTALQE